MADRISPQDVADFYLNNYLKDGTPQQVPTTVTFQIGVGDEALVLKVPNITLDPSATVSDILRSYYAHLVGAQEKETAETAKEQPEEKQEGTTEKVTYKDFRVIEKGKSKYLITELTTGQYIIQNQTKQKMISHDCPLGRTLISMYRKEVYGEE